MAILATINNSSSTVTVTPPAGEVWMLTSWAGFANAGTSSTKFGTTDLPGLCVTGYANATAVLDTLGSRTTLAPVFSSTVPLVITPSGNVSGIATGYKFPTANAPYLPVKLSVVGLASGSRLSLQPPAGKVWRLLAITASKGLNFLNIDVATDSTPSWVGTANPADYLVGGRADLWSWRDKPLAVWNPSGATANVYTYLLEFNESDFLSSRVYGTQTIAAGGTFDIRPPSGEEWTIDGLYTTQASYSLTQMASGSVVGSAISWGSAAGKALGPFRIDNGSYIRVTNTSGSSATLVYLGRKTN